MNYQEAAFVTGVLGDLGLQAIVKFTDRDWGLRSYFAHHGPVASVFIAAAMMWGGARAYQLMSGVDIPLLERDWRSMLATAAAYDLFFRYARPMPSLDGYYAALSVPMSITWAFIPMVMPLLLVREPYRLRL